MSQEKQIEQHLLKGGSITALTALKKFGCLRLSGRILELRQRHNVHTEMITVGSKRIARYTIPIMLALFILSSCATVKQPDPKPEREGVRPKIVNSKD
jgi:hypothetical protein